MRAKIFIFLLSISAIFFISYFSAPPKEKGPLYDTHAYLGDTPLLLAVADTPELRERGLSFTGELKDGEGMFFVFEEAGYPGFWMKNMNYPIDMIWFDEKKSIVDIRENVAPGTYPRVFQPLSPARYALEVPAFFTKKNNIKKGDRISF
ncbi:MAG: DUF192 domain-containing protein [Patescibacteria group bacterium]